MPQHAAGYQRSVSVARMYVTRGTGVHYVSRSAEQAYTELQVGPVLALRGTCLDV